MWNSNRTPPREFLEILENDEEDSGSELEEDEEEVVLGDQDGHEDEEEMGAEMDINNMPFFSMCPEGTLQPLQSSSFVHHLGPRSSSSSEHHLFPDVGSEATTRPLDESWRERSPLRSPSSTPPPYSPLSSPRQREEEVESNFVNFTERAEVATSHDFAGSSRGRGQARTRGSRPRGGNRGRGRRAATRAVDGESGWRWGERVIEVCLDDEDVPPSLREMVHNLEAARHARNAQQMRRRRNVRTNGDESESEDEYFDTESSMAHELFGGDTAALRFQWSPMTTFSGHREEFQSERTGPSCNTTSAYEAFRQYWDDDILQHIVR